MSHDAPSWGCAARGATNGAPVGTETPDSAAGHTGPKTAMGWALLAGRNARLLAAESARVAELEAQVSEARAAIARVRDAAHGEIAAHTQYLCLRTMLPASFILDLLEEPETSGDSGSGHGNEDRS